MDKTIEIIMVVTVLLMTAVSVMFMFSDRGSQFGQWANNTQTSAECELKLAKYKQACDCSASGSNQLTQDAQSIASTARNELSCDWASSGGNTNTDCQSYC